MAFETIDKLVKDKFYSIYNKAVADAEQIFNDKYVPEYQALPLYDQLLFLKSESDRLETEGDQSLNSVYFHNHKSKEWLLKAFSSRSVILNIDESDSLYECVIAGTLESKFSLLYYDLCDTVPPYSYADFLDKKYNRYFFEMELFTITQKEDYYKIRSWQCDKLVSIVNTEVNLIVDAFRKTLNQAPSIFQHLDTLKLHYEWLFEKSDFSNPSELITELQKFPFLKGYVFKQLDNSDALADFNSIVLNKNIYSRLTPDYIDSTRSRYSSCKYHPTFSTSPVIFFSILRVMYWVEKVIETKNINTPYELIDYDKLFTQTWVYAKKEAVKLFEEFEKKHNIADLDKDQLLKLYRDKIETLRHEFKQEGLFHHYFDGLDLEKSLATAFKINCFISGDNNDNIANLKKAIILKESFIEYISWIYEITGNRHIEENFQGANYIEIMYLVHNMVLDSDLYKRMNDLMYKSMMDFENTGMPFDIIRLDMTEGMNAIFNECIDRLLNYLEDCEGSNKVLYVHSRLKQLKQRELQLRKYKDDGFEFDTGKYTTLFKEYLEIEADYIRDTKDINIIPSLAIGTNFKLLDNPVKKPVKQIHNSFTYKMYNTDQSKLTDFYNSLIAQGFISDQTTLAAFRKIFTNQKPDPPIVWTGSIPELDYLIKFIHLDYKVIKPITRGIWDIVYECFDNKEQGKKFNRDSLGGQAPPPSAEFLRVAARHL